MKKVALKIWTILLAVLAFLFSIPMAYMEGFKRSKILAMPRKTAAMAKIVGSIERSVGNDSIILNGIEYPTIQAAMNAIAAAGQIIVVGPGTYAEDVTWTKYKNCILAALIPGTVVIEAVTAFAVKMDPALTDAKTWTGTIQGIELSHGNGLVGLQVNNTNVGARMNIMLNDIDIESQTATDHAIDVNRAGTAAIRIYATGHGNTIEGLVDYISEVAADDRVRFWGYRLVGGLTITGAYAMELTLVNCGIKTSGLTVDGANVYNLVGCYYETDDNPNVHTLCADAVEQ